MTGQSSDWVFYQGRRYDLLSDSSQILPMLDELGIRPMYIGTATRRGYEAEYEIDNNQLYLTKLNVGSEAYMDQFPPIGNVSPVKESTSFNIEDGKYTLYYDLFYRLKYPIYINTTLAINCFGVDDRQEQDERRKQFEKNPSLPQESRPYSNPFPREILKLKIMKGRVQTIKDVTERYMNLQNAVDTFWQKRRDLSHLDAQAKYQNEDWSEVKKQYYDFLSEEIE